MGFQCPIVLLGELVSAITVGDREPTSQQFGPEVLSLLRASKRRAVDVPRRTLSRVG